MINQIINDNKNKMLYNAQWFSNEFNAFYFDLSFINLIGDYIFRSNYLQTKTKNFVLFNKLKNFYLNIVYHYK